MSKQNKDETDFDALRNLLLGAEKDKIEVLEQHFDDPEIQIQDVSSILPQAIKLSASQNHELTDELMPLVEEAIQVSVKRDINVFADALYPVMGPAIRKSMSETLMQMIQSINRAIEYSFSWQGIKWRFEAWRSGKPFAEIVLLHSLVYQVEQVFLIHRKTGLLLHHTTLSEVIQQDADLVSAMLTAIQDFVHDSFNDSLTDSHTKSSSDNTNHSSSNEADKEVKDQNTSEHALNQISMGDFSIWIEQGPDAVIAAVLKGAAPKTLRHELIATLEHIHQHYAKEMQNFDGDEAAFNQLEEPLRGCLKSQYQSENKKISWMTWVGMAGILMAIFAWLFLHFQETQNWQNYVQLIKSEPGIVVTDISKEDGQYIVRGLWDPLARHPEQILLDSSLTQPMSLGPVTVDLLNEDQIVLNFEPYQSLTGEFIHKRVMKLLDPPATVDVEIKDGVLTVSGRASPDWITQLKNQSVFITGVNQLDIHQLKSVIDLSKINVPDTVQLNIIGENVIATGHAPYDWLMAAKKQIDKIPGVKKYDDTQLKIDVDLSSLNAPKDVIFDYNNGLLTVAGIAPNHWLKNIQRNALSISGVDEVNIDELRNSDKILLIQLKKALESEAIFFNPGQSNYSSISLDDNLNRIVSNAQLLIQKADLLAIKVKIIIQGFSDSQGSYHSRYNIGFLRAEHIRQYFVSRGINEPLLEAQSMATENNAIITLTEQENRFNRRVSFVIQFPNEINRK